MSYCQQENRKVNYSRDLNHVTTNNGILTEPPLWKKKTGIKFTYGKYHKLGREEWSLVQQAGIKEYKILISVYRNQAKQIWSHFLQLIKNTLYLSREIDQYLISKAIVQNHISEAMDQILEIYDKFKRDGHKLQKSFAENRANKVWSLDRKVCQFHGPNDTNCVKYFGEIDKLYENLYKYYEDNLLRAYKEGIDAFNFELKKLKIEEVEIPEVIQNELLKLKKLESKKDESEKDVNP